MTSSPRAYKRAGRRAQLMAFLSGVTLTMACSWLKVGSAGLNLSWMPLSASPRHQSAAQWLLPPPMPWKPLLKAAQLRRGLSFYGSGERIERVAAKLMAGEPITAVTIGGSVTRGAGARSADTNYPSRFFDFIRTTFPNRRHVLLNKGIGGTTSGIFSVCAEVLVPQETDLVVVEFTFNEEANLPYTSPSRRGFEQLLRKLLRLPNSPAIIMLHHYAWYFSFGDGVDSGLFYRQAEEQLGTMAQYYDMPAPSVRNALYLQMQADEEPYGVTRVHAPGSLNSKDRRIRVAGPRIAHKYFYADTIHPSDTGHQIMAELLAGVVMTAVQTVAQRAAPQAGSGEAASSEAVLNATQLLAAVGSTRLELPPPLVPGNAENPTTLCAMQEDFKGVAYKLNGFSYKAEKPDKVAFVEQKWGYRAEQPGAWMELKVNTEEIPGSQGTATVLLGHLKSYSDMAVAVAECRSGCRCTRSLIDGLWKTKVSLMQMHKLEVTQHARCIIRVTVIERSAAIPGGARPAGAGRKFQLSSLMVAHTPLVLSSYQQQAQDLASSTARGS